MPEITPSRAADPHRATRRNHYQEGPGFLFLATQNGRPSGADNRPNLDGVRKRMRAVRRAQEVGIEAAAGEIGVPQRSLYRWSAIFEAKGIEGLLDGCRRPHRLRTTTPAWVDTVVIAIRLHTYWNSKRIAAEMRRRQIFRVSPGHIDQLFKTLGCSRGTVPRAPGPRYERSQPNELWHVDIKGPFFINLSSREYVRTWILGLVDDHSRFVIGLTILTGTTAAGVLSWLDECFELCGQPLELMSDNGQPFVTWLPGVLTRFGKHLRDLRVRHLRTQINSPWTNGKIEAFWDILQQEVLDRQRFNSLVQAETAMASFATYYNYHRLSGVLGWLTPAERYEGTPFIDRGFENIPQLAHLESWLSELMAVA